MLWLLLCLCTFGIYILWWTYSRAETVYREVGGRTDNDRINGLRPDGFVATQWSVGNGRGLRQSPVSRVKADRGTCRYVWRGYEI